MCLTIKDTQIRVISACLGEALARMDGDFSLFPEHYAAFRDSEAENFEILGPANTPLAHPSTLKLFLDA
jgi:hypothetical protein